jgi:cell wall-associated NlpC family hydrolase
MTDVSSVAPVVAQVQALSATLGGLGTALEQAAPSGAFANVLDAVQAQMAAIGSNAASTSATGPAFVATDSLLGSPGGPDAGAGGAEPTGQQVVAEAEQFLGVPYQWGGTSPTTGFDCSGLVQYVFGQLGVSLPRTSEEQATVGTPVASVADAQPGDLVFYEPGPGGPGHVGIYIGNGQIIDAPHTGTNVQIQPVGQPSEIRRVLPDTATPGQAIPATLGVPASLAPLFEQVGASTGVPASLLAAVAKQESGFDPQAVSSAGAEGLMQLMPSTAAGLGVNPFDPLQAVTGAAQLLGSYLQQYNGSVPLALAAYNAGPGAVARYGGIPPYSQTQQYVADIMASLEGSA